MSHNVGFSINGLKSNLNRIERWVVVNMDYLRVNRLKSNLNRIESKIIFFILF